jgi:hypothetical protein
MTAAFIAIGSEPAPFDGGLLTFVIAGVFIVCAAMLLRGAR